MRVGYVGLGAMGRELARHLAGSYALVVWDLNPDAIADIAAKGATAARSLAEIGACNVIILCLPKSANVEQALFGTGGLAEHLAPGTVVIDQTSGVPSATAKFAERLAARGVAMIDAPVAGGVPSAIAGQITIMASGPSEAFARIRPVLAAISPKLFHCGETVGAGQALKAVNNLINTGYRMATLELLGLACRMGFPAAATTDAMNAGASRSFVTQRLLPSIVAGASSADFALGLMVKDVNQAAELAIGPNVVMPVSDAARSLMNTALNLLGQDSRLDDLVPFMERATAASFTASPKAGSALATDATMALLVTAMAAGNRAIMRENIALATGAGLAVTGFAPVINAGSGSSVQAEQLFAGEQGDAMSDRDALVALNELSRIAASLGVPLTITSQIRAHYLAIETSAVPNRKGTTR